MSDQHEDDLVSRMECQLQAWDVDEPRSDWWNYQREYAQAKARIADLNAEVGRHIAAYQIAFDQAMENGERAADLTRQLADARAVLRVADDALRNHACHGGPSAPCLRSDTDCQFDCGKQAGDALLVVEAALNPEQTK